MSETMRAFEKDETMEAFVYLLNEIRDQRPKLYRRLMAGEITLLQSFKEGELSLGWDENDQVVYYRDDDGNIRTAPMD